MIDVLIQAFWGDRAEDADHVSLRLGSVIERFHGIEPAWNRWRSPRTRHTFSVPFGDELNEVVSRGVNRRDSDRRPIEHLGFSGRLVTSGVDTELEVAFTCGAYELDSLSNFLVVRLGSTAASISSSPHVRPMFDAVVMSMAPDHASVTVIDAADAVVSPDLPRPGWMVYLNESRFVRPASGPVERYADPPGWLFALPDPWTREQLAGRGPAGDFAAGVTRKDSA